jgi:hypothetical protein
MRKLSVILFLVTIVPIVATWPTQSPRLSAATYYIATNPDWKGLPDQMLIDGASNLPPGSRLGIDILDFVGQGSSSLNEDAVATVDDQGFFQATLKAKPGSQFRHNLVCNVVFMTTYPRQEPTVLQIVGRSGENLGFPKNPQARVISGGYYLSEMTHVP